MPGSLRMAGVIRLRGNFAARRSHFAQDDNLYPNASPAPSIQ
jgi:hypothetical protein